MNILYFDCMSGISGDMAVGAFLDMGIEPAALAKELSKVPIPAVYDIESEKTEKNHVMATAFRVIPSKVQQEYVWEELRQTVAVSGLSEEAKKTVLRIMRIYGEAVARIAGCDAKNLVFPGKEAMVTLVNVLSVSVCVDWLSPDAVVCSPLTEGAGFAETHFGMMRVPVPAVLEMMRKTGAPLEICGEKTQLITPTGAAIACGLAQRFDELPSMTVSAVGFGAGTKDLDTRANVLRAILGRNESRFFEESVCVIDTQIPWYAGGFLSSCE